MSFFAWQFTNHWRPGVTTNLVANGGFETNTAGWSDGTSGSILARITTDAKFGVACCEITNLPATSSSTFLRLNPDLTVVSGHTYTFSIWVKGTPGSKIRLNLSDSVTDTNSPDITLTSTWTLYWLAKTVASIALIVRLSTRDTTSPTVQVDGAQVEQRAFSTYYVETDGAAKTRPALFGDTFYDPILGR